MLIPWPYRLCTLATLLMLSACAVSPKKPLKVLPDRSLVRAEILGYELSFPNLRIYTWNLGCTKVDMLDFALRREPAHWLFHLYRPESESCYTEKRKMYIDIAIDKYIEEREVLMIALDTKSL